MNALSLNLMSLNTTSAYPPKAPMSLVVYDSLDLLLSQIQSHLANHLLIKKEFVFMKILYKKRKYNVNER